MSHAKKTILLVDPDTSLRARLRSLLEPHYDVLEANDGTEAVAITEAPALIVSETLLPRVDGFTMVKMLRNRPAMRRVPILFFTTQHAPQHVAQALVIGVEHYLPKTTSAAELVDKIRKLVL